MTGSENSITYTLVDSAAFDREWVALIRQIGEFVPGDFVSRMLKLPSAWEAFMMFVEAVMYRKEQAGCARDHRERI